jgi:hypothetical protein
MSNVSQFRKMGTWIKGRIRKAWYKKYTSKRNRKKLRQSRDIENHVDKPLDPWALD